MRCGCPRCSTYMIQAERGLQSGCVCPACGFVCRACMGHDQQLLNRETFLQEYIMRKAMEQPMEEDDDC